MIPLVTYAGFGTHISVRRMILCSLRLLTFFRLIRLFIIIISYFEESEFIFIASFAAVTIIFGAVAMYLAEAPNDKASKAITGGCTFSIIQLDSSNFLI
jgi:hypothetical protein